MIRVLDTTLREGEQTPGVYFDSHIKLAIAELLNDIGIDIIETGHPKVTEDIYTAVKTIANKGFNSIIAAHARSVQGDVELAIECGVNFIGIFYCVSDERLDNVFKTNLDSAIEQIASTIKYVKSVNPDIIVRYTPEDTVRSKFENVIAASVAACNAGADVISIADTTGYMVPGTGHNMYDYVKNLKSELEKRNCFPSIAVHCHNDRGLALANVLDGIRGGASIVDASVLGLGERAGIVDLAQLLTILETEFGVTKYDLTKLPKLYEFVSTHSDVLIPKNFPAIGANAFTHCAGVHTHAAAVNPMHYESLEPSLFGRERHFSLDHMSGLAAVKFALKSRNIENISAEDELEILSEIKSIGQRGRTVDVEELPHIVDIIKHKQIIKKTK